MLCESIKWNSIQDVFKCIEEAKCNYVVLRSAEEIFDDEKYLFEGHDIDILCEQSDVNKLVDAMRLERTIHCSSYILNVANRNISIDITSPGSGEYDSLWEQHILIRRIVFKDSLCHTPSDEDYFYTLLYHSLVHKKQFPERYRERIRKLAHKLGMKLKFEPDNSSISKYYYTILLKKFMKKKGYEIKELYKDNFFHRIWEEERQFIERIIWKLKE
ncbi:MAG: hypothetical protein ACI4F0_10195 [Agathobacter sp.]